MDKNTFIDYFNHASHKRSFWIKKNSYYHKDIASLCSFAIPKNSSVLEIGCGTGHLLSQIQAEKKVGIDYSENMLTIARAQNPDATFIKDDIEALTYTDTFDFIIMQDLISCLLDIWSAFRNLHTLVKPNSRIIITFYNRLWGPIIRLAETFGLKDKQPYQNWLSASDVEHLLSLNNFEIINKGYRLLFPIYIPLITPFFNRYVSKLPFIRAFCLTGYIIARPSQNPVTRIDYTCSIIVPTRNEAGNVERIVTELPSLGKGTEIIFVDGKSSDGTIDKIEEMAKRLPHKNIKLVHQGDGIGKGDAVRKGFDAASNEMLIIFDADITVHPNDIQKFYLALAEGKGEFINGTRLVYPMEKRAMRTLNYFGNEFFSLLFTWLLNQDIRDTLCGTKVILKKDYEKLKEGRSFFGDFDPFGDFDLLFGAAKLNLKIIELPIRYRERTYGTTKISRFRHGWLLLKMSWVAYKKFGMQ